jgi:hypothetical protein
MTGPGSADASRMRIAGIVLLAVAGVAAVVGLLALGGESPSSPTAAPASPTAQPLPGAVSSPAPAPPDQAAAPPVGVPPGGPAVPPGGGLAPGGTGPAPAGGPAVGAPIVPGGGAGGGGAGGGVAGGGSGGGGGAGVNQAVEVRVFNNSTIQGLADRAAGQMRDRGWNVVEVGNYPSGVIPESTVYYRPGTGEEGAADAIAGQFGLRSMPRFDGIQGASPGVIVIATNNWGANQG